MLDCFGLWLDDRSDRARSGRFAEFVEEECQTCSLLSCRLASDLQNFAITGSTKAAPTSRSDFL
jgi:hypothetical protein